MNTPLYVPAEPHSPQPATANKEFALTTMAAQEGALPPVWPLERLFNRIMEGMTLLSALFIGLLLIPILVDIVMRPWGGLRGVMDMETMALVVIGFIVLAYATVTRQQISIDLFYTMFSPRTQRRLDCFSHLFAVPACALLAWYIFIAAGRSSGYSPIFRWNYSIFISVTCFGVATLGLASFYQLLHTLRHLWQERDLLGFLLPLAVVLLLFSLPFAYKASSLSLSNLTLGALGFVILFSMLLLKIPIGIGMTGIAILGLLALMRTPTAVGTAVGLVPFRQGSDFIFLAVPMFMLMGEMISLAGLSEALFDCAGKWLGQLPGGLACASVGGCAGFGAVCGDSMATCITMSAVAMKPMRERGYSSALAAGSLAAGGTLGILIPPSLGFIFYSMMTQQSVGKLFVAGILPGILLASIFIITIVIMARRNPQLAPAGEHYSMGEKLRSLISIIPVLIIFFLVVGGIMMGLFTPGEGGAVGAMTAIMYAAARRRLSLSLMVEAFRRTAVMCAKIFVILVGVFIFGVFLTTSRLPMLLANAIVGLAISPWLVLGVIILVYIMLGCVMNIIPMMMLTLPSIFPTVQALGFDGIWFGVITVIVMEMGMITPPIGMNVFTMASLNPDISMATIFRGVLPFFLGMLLCVLLILLFPQIALYLPGLTG